MKYTSEFPKFKNMDEREKFIDGYKTWEQWFINPKTGEILYKIKVPGTEDFIVAKWFQVFSNWNHKVVENVLYYVIKPEIQFFEDGKVSKTELKEYLKNIQKN